MVSSDVFTQSSGNFRIGLKRCNAAFFPDEPRTEQREKADICADIMEIHPGPQMLLQGALNFGLSFTLEYSSASARIQPQPQARCGTLLDLHPG
jgi:hypothetical protein